jgi:CheY-like chemotaxis protein
MSGATGVSARTPRVLIVDDSAPARRLLIAALCGLAVEIEEANEGFTAFQIVLGAQIDLVITDLNMEPVDGRQLVMAMQLLPQARRPRIIVCTSDWDASNQKTRLALRAADLVFGKPVPAENLIAGVSNLLPGGVPRA